MFKRRQFVFSLSAATCAVGLPLTWKKRRIGSPKLEKSLRLALAHYGDLIHLSQENKQIVASAKIRDIHKLPEACSMLSQWGNVYAGGNRLEFDADEYHVQIRNFS